MQVVDTTEGDGPLVLSMPHCGTGLPASIAARLNETGRALADTDWWIDRLYDFGAEMGASVVKANLSRYVVDLNRDPSGQSLYPGQATTWLCPTETFDGNPLYLPGEVPTADEIEARKTAYFAPYHAALEGALARAKARHGFALLYDCHSIRSVVPRLFDGTLPTVNIGTNGGASCAPPIAEAVTGACAKQDDFGFVTNGRFKGGWITRHYGQPSQGIHALQVELAQSAYMEERPPWTFDDAKADRLRVLLRAMTGAFARAGTELYA
jgi:formiminoglutamase